MNPKKLFVIGTGLTLVLLSFWMWRTSAPEIPVGERASTKPSQLAADSQKALPGHGPLPTPQGVIASLPSSEVLGTEPSPLQGTESEEKATWTKPEKSIYWDQVPVQKQAIDFLAKLSEMNFPQKEKPLYVGMNDQGFDQYEYKSSNGAEVTEWKRSNEVVIEEAILPNGDKITRKAVEPDNPVSMVSYESTANKTYQRTTYKANGSIDSLRMDHNGHTVIYYYDDQGRVQMTYSGPTP